MNLGDIYDVLVEQRSWLLGFPKSGDTFTMDLCGWCPDLCAELIIEIDNCGLKIQRRAVILARVGRLTVFQISEI
jgi:hypothetical protein